MSARMATIITIIIDLNRHAVTLRNIQKPTIRTTSM